MSYLVTICIKLLKRLLTSCNPGILGILKNVEEKSQDFLLELDRKLYSYICMKHRYPGNTLYTCLIKDINNPWINGSKWLFLWYLMNNLYIVLIPWIKKISDFQDSHLGQGGMYTADVHCRLICPIRERGWDQLRGGRVETLPFFFSPVLLGGGGHIPAAPSSPLATPL